MANASYPQLQQCLNNELSLLQGFIALLEDEAKVLLEPTHDHDLADNTAKKNAWAEKLADAGQQREQLLAEVGLEANRRGLETLANNHPRLAPTVHKLLQAAAEANELNTRNGMIIDTYLAHHQQTLDALRNLVGEGTIYDARGRTKRGGKGSGRNIKAG